ncbi:WYL domain-containing protein [Frankia sp. AgKG'84/4]|uniref:WYL domain-containing protein n=1 Tax=Frankia sp. AgKG'84/4 TaxID=573490 RepID=UPI00202A1537|nr:WYL domain-containing protein [Frankia sp. AgKG'84/4]MCL9797849.1 WYL domain-containing protein [Frankia sp. AgKG'84/4]
MARHRERVRSYRVGRIVRVGMRGEVFDRPAGFDLATWWRERGEDFARSLMRWQCRLRLSPAALAGLRHAVGPVAARDALAGAGPPDADGWQVVEVSTEGPDVALTQLLLLGDGVEVLAPATLRAALAAQALRTATRNAGALTLTDDDRVDRTGG